MDQFTFYTSAMNTAHFRAEGSNLFGTQVLISELSNFYKNEEQSQTGFYIRYLICNQYSVIGNQYYLIYQAFTDY